MFKVNNKRQQNDGFLIVIVSLLLYLNRFHTLFYCLYCLYSNISTADFEQVSVNSDDIKIWSHCVSFLMFILFPRCFLSILPETIRLDLVYLSYSQNFLEKRSHWEIIILPRDWYQHFSLKRNFPTQLNLLYEAIRILRNSVVFFSVY